MTKELTLESMRLWIASFAHRVAIIRREERERCAKKVEQSSSFATNSEIAADIRALEDEK